MDSTPYLDHRMRLRVSSVRQAALGLLDAAARCSGKTSARRPNVIDRLQHVANDLGAVEALVEQAPAEPAPIARADRPPPTAASPALDAEAAALLAHARTSIPLSGSRADEAERWLRVMRRHGIVGELLATLGIAELPLATPADPAALARARMVGEAAVERVGKTAVELAALRGAGFVSTVDVLFATLEIYGGMLDRVLYTRGITREQLISRLTTLAGRAPAAIRP